MEKRNTEENGSGLEKFLAAQEHDYSVALSEISSGKKRSHWMWYIFPQIQGLGYSDMAKHYAIRDLEQAAAYLAHPVLGTRLLGITETLLTQSGLTPQEIFGSPDDIKLCSSMTLFAAVKAAPPIFQQVINQFFSGVCDSKTQHILELQAEV